jgi:hypothetical protein
MDDRKRKLLRTTGILSIVVGVFAFILAVYKSTLFSSPQQQALAQAQADFQAQTLMQTKLQQAYYSTGLGAGAGADSSGVSAGRTYTGTPSASSLVHVQQGRSSLSLPQVQLVRCIPFQLSKFPTLPRREILFDLIFFSCSVKKFLYRQFYSCRAVCLSSLS